MPSAQTTERLRDLEEEREQFQAERVALLEDNRSLKARLARAEIAVTEIESLRDQKAALETSRSLLEAALRELRTDVEERIKRSDGRCPFPSSAAMDNDEKLQTAPSTRQKIFDLPGFVDDVRHAIATGRATGKKLYYSERDLRCFLGGLAMSRLHLLQGISGTGKTSLPVAFAGAIGAGCKVIEIQAGWRDRQDLLGHYNAFERKFYESEFLLALYRAGCPRYEPLPFIIVLDEMNLSHPEQYFAEFISKLEQPSRARQIELTTEAVEPAPRLFQEGRILPLPRNVWFVGTANHDETTTVNGPVPLARMGSGENWVGYHVLAHLALHKWFRQKERPVPGFLFLDQPSQAHYPPEKDVNGAIEGLKDEDQEAVMRLFKLIYDAAEEMAPGMQIIVTDHADLKTDWFAASVIARWRGHEKLVPQEWYTAIG